jgi:RNA polymerase sigma-70 factor (ECF subfamily)
MDLFDPYRGTVKTCLLQIAHNRSIDRRYHLLRRQFYDHSTLEDSKIAHWTSSPCTTHGLARSEAIRLVRQVLETLPKVQRTAIQLIHFEGLTFEEMATRTNQTLSAAKHQYYRGILKLRDAITGERNVPPIHSDFTASSACGFVSAVRERTDAFAA